jgi:SOS-response transcriptional repressor LexA
MTREAVLELVRFVDRFWREHGYGPTHREVQAGLGLSSSSVAWYRARAAARLGWLRWDDGRDRTLRLTKAGAVLGGDGSPRRRWRRDPPWALRLLGVAEYALDDLRALDEHETGIGPCMFCDTRRRFLLAISTARRAVYGSGKLSGVYLAKGGSRVKEG